jgi:hypothetical protein
MTNVYVVINKWTTTDANSPGYISGFGVGILLDELARNPGDTQHFTTVLQNNGVDPQFFDQTIYSNYVSASMAVQQQGKITGFAWAELDRSMRFSLLIYASEQDDFFLDDNPSQVVENMNAARTAYMQLTNLACETRRGYKDIPDDILEKVYMQIPLTLDQIQSIFDSL